MRKPTREPNRTEDVDLRALYVALDATEISMKRAMFTVEKKALARHRSLLLGDIKKRERKHANSC